MVPESISTATALLFPIVTSLVVGAWILGTLIHRDHPWSIAGWIPLTGLAGIGSLVLAGQMLGCGHEFRGAEGGFSAMGAAALLPLMLPCPLFLGLSLYVRPRGRHSPWAIICSSLLLLVLLGLLRLLSKEP